MSLPHKIILLVFSLLILLANLSCSSPNFIAGKSIVYYASPEEAIARIRKTDGLKGTLKVIARVEIRSGEDSYPVKAAMIAQKPGSLRIETIPLIGPPDFFMTINKDALKVFYPGRDLFYIGKATQGNLIKFFPLAISPYMMVAFLTGSYPEYIPSNGYVSSHGRPDADRSLYRLDLIDNGVTRQSCWIEPHGHYLVRIDSFDDAGRLAYTVKYDNFKRLGKVDFPHELNFEACVEMKCQCGRIRYYDTELTPDVDNTVFDITPPIGIKTTPLE